MTHPAPNSELTPESVKLLKAGDVLWAAVHGVPVTVREAVGASVAYVHPDYAPDGCVIVGAGLEYLSFIGRPDADGWIPHDGGPNPVPGCVVDVWEYGETWTDTPPEPALKWENVVAFRLAAPSVEREQGSSLRDTHRAADDPWAVLEGLAKAATPGPWRCVSEARVHSNRSEGRHEVCFVDQQWGENRTGNAAYIAAADPSTVLKLIEAARASQVGMEREARNEPKDEIIQRQGEEIERLRGELAEVIDAALRQLAMMGKGRDPSPRLQAAIDAARARQGGPDHG